MRRSRPILLLVAAALVASAVAAPASAAPATPTTFTILHTNDFHGQLEPAGSNPGSARVAQVVNDIRASVGAASTLLVDAGDEMQGSLLSNLGDGTATGKGIPTIATYNAMGYDVATFGNHELGLVGSGATPQSAGVPLSMKRSRIAALAAVILLVATTAPAALARPGDGSKAEEKCPDHRGPDPRAQRLPREPGAAERLGGPDRALPIAAGSASPPDCDPRRRRGVSRDPRPHARGDQPEHALRVRWRHDRRHAAGLGPVP